MPPEISEHPAFFETPARAERLQLLLHLARNAAEAFYLRGPVGAGKTRLVDALQQFADDLAVVRLDLSEPVRPIAGILQQLRLPPEAADRWPDQLLGALGERQLLVVVDSADALDDATWQQLARLPDYGVRLLLVGHGDGAGDSRVQYVDLPPFSPAESAAFLKAVAGGMADRITDEMTEAAHTTAAGRPGVLLDALRGFLESEPPPNEPVPAETPSSEAQPIETRPFEPPPIKTPSIESGEAERPNVAQETDRPTPLDVAPPVARATPAPVAPTPSRPRVEDPSPGRSSAPRGGPRPMDADKVLHRGIGNLWAWGGAGLLALVLVAVLVFQDEINSLVAPPPDQPVLNDEGVAAPDPDAPPDRPVVVEAPLKPVGDIPPIALPELSQAAATGVGEVPGQRPAEAIDQAIGSPPLSPGDPDDRQPAPQAAETAEVVDDTGDDLLDAVMQDALKAQPVAADAEPPGDSGTDPDSSVAMVPDTSETDLPESEVPKTEASEGQATETEAPPVVAVPAPEPVAQPGATVAADAPAEPGRTTKTPEADQAPAETPGDMPDIGAQGATDRTAREADEPIPAPVVERGTVQAALSRSAASPARGDNPVVPAPVEERVVSSRPADPKRASRGEALTGERWLISREPAHYTLQLVGARDRAAIARFVEIHGVSPPFAVFERQLDGAAWFSLVVGDYPDRDAAVAARARLPASLSGAGVWPRTFASIQALR